MRKYRGSVNFKDEDFKVEVIFILVYYFGIFIFPTVVIDDKVFMSISDLKSVDSINHSNLDLLVSMSWSISLVLVLSFILKRILLHKNLEFLAFLQMFLCMIYCVVALFYFKNYFFNRDDIEKYNEYWKEVFEKDEETKNYWDREIIAGRLRRTFIDLFFFAYLQIKIQETDFKVKAEDKDAYAKVEHLFESYKNFIRSYLNDDKEAILSEIKEYALLFKKNFNYEILEEELTQDFGIDRINTIIFGLDTTTLIPYTLYILRNILDETTKNELFGIIETYIMRRIITHSNTKNYNQLFTDKLINNRVLSKQEFLDYIEKRDDKVNYLPTDEELEKGFNSSILINKQSAGILYLIESKIRNGKDSTALLGINKYSLEHLMPKKWRNNWDKLSSKESEINRDRKLLTLGNLTIITQSLNSSIRDSKWEDKLKGKNKKGGLIEYSGGLKTISQFLEYSEWDEKTIEERALFLYEKAKQIWKI